MTKVKLNSDYAIFGLLGLIWGSNFLLMKNAGRVVTPLQVTWLRVLCGAAPILALACARGCLKRDHLRHWPHFVVLAVVTSIIPYLGFAHGTRDLKSGAAGAIAGVVPLLVAAFAALTLPTDRLSWRKVVGLSIGCLGVALVGQIGTGATVEGAHVLRGMLFTAAGALGYAVAVVYQRRFVSPLHLNPLALACYQMVIAAIILTFLAPKTGLGDLLAQPGALWTLTLGLGALGTGVAFIMYYHIVEKLGAVTASSVFYLPPVVALVLGACVAGEWITGGQCLGAGLILLGVWLARKNATTPTYAMPRTQTSH